MDVGLLFLRMLLILASVCALAFVSLKWGLRRFDPMRTRHGAGLLEVEERLYLGPNQCLYLLRVGRERHLIGGSEGELRHLLDVTREAEFLATPAGGTPREVPGSH